MDVKVIYAFCIAGLMFLPGGVPGVILLFFPHKGINLALKLFDKLSILGFSREDLPVNPYGKFTVVFYRVLGFMFVSFSAIPVLVIFYGCILRKCTFV